MALAFIAGSNLLEHPPFHGARGEAVATPFGEAVAYRGDGCVLVLRHGPEGIIAPHRINHHANIDAFRRLGCRRVVSFCSVGGLRPDRAPTGTLLVPDDYINLWPVLTFHDEDPQYATPLLSETLRRELVEVLADLGERFVDGGVYFQTVGPRLETRAEVWLIARDADVVGMTFGHEATLCAEAGLEVAAVCSIDNPAHGLAAEPLHASEILRRKAEQGRRFAAIAAALVAADARRRAPAGDA
jgi:5'-methylthioadenosine phosphorylase